MSIPKAKKGESTQSFMYRCLSDSHMIKVYKNKTQRVAVCSLELKIRDEKVKNQKAKAKSKQSKSNKG
ncbi:MAG: hypothetical protein Unbinned3205contig1001_31 [Prokaryotic dsDNA virus sp.]|mgnify:CR=1 FL=1|nr:MAG: hypothetical protein Unbinned3205contig1001_31 [Prokaryotic dsDNA virus sp.]